jgi:acyl-coenzyme A synthetase/AMP-(fatty) acid ligase
MPPPVPSRRQLPAAASAAVATRLLAPPPAWAATRPNVAATWETLLACTKLGVVVVPATPQLGPE